LATSLLAGTTIFTGDLAGRLAIPRALLSRYCREGALFADEAPLPGSGPQLRLRLNPKLLKPFVDRLTIPGIKRPNGTRPSRVKGAGPVPYYVIAMSQSSAKIHRDLPVTTMWSYDGISPGPTIEARSGQPLMVEWVNQLPLTHILPVDHRLCGAGPGVPDVRAIVHLHGAKVTPENDGYPENWYTPGKSLVSFYPNQQDATTLWYHDHAIGITRLNIFAGLFGLYVIRDDVEKRLDLPRGKYEIPLTICDRDFDTKGQLNYPVSPDPSAPWVSEFVGNAILVNGKLFPFLEVEPRRYRFRFANVSNGRTFHLILPNSKMGHSIGSDQGLLERPVAVADVVVAPAERADLIIDFSDHRGQELVLRNDADAILQFRVSATPVKDKSALPATLRPITRIPESRAVRTRLLTLDDQEDGMGNPKTMLLNGSGWRSAVTESPVLGSTEIWSFVNRTEDVHPIHLHAVKFQVLDRREFDPVAFMLYRALHYKGPAVQPEPAEMGWKDTVRALPNMVTRIVVPFDGYAGRYVWHCHLLEHEDNEMMRPYEILAPA
jgi:spore coat protein A